MISRICGKLKSKDKNSVFIEINGLVYEIMVPLTVMRALEEGKRSDGTIELFTYHYYQLDQSKGIPVLIGFVNEIEKEFFEKFITVSGIGPKAACRALSMPISTIADAIDKGDFDLLKELPGIGEQRAREIVAKLQGKVGKFGLIQDKKDAAEPVLGASDSITEEALAVLTQLEYKRKEAVDMVKNALKNNSRITSCEELLNEVYKQKHNKVLNG